MFLRFNQLHTYEYHITFVWSKEKYVLNGGKVGRVRRVGSKTYNLQLPNPCPLLRYPKYSSFKFQDLQRF